MELLANLGLGFETALTPVNILYCFLGVLLGTLVGVLPGIGPTATIAMLLPITLSLSPVTALIMLAGIYYGAQYGGSTTAILVNLPGESSSAVTAIDGYQMARQGQAGHALAAAALGSFCAGTVATLFLAVLAPPLTDVALKFGPAEYFSLMFLGLIMSVALAHGSIVKALAMVVLGLLLGMVGTDIYTGTPRFTMGFFELADGINFVAVAVGVFGIAEILRNLENERERDVRVQHVSNLMPTRHELKKIAGPVVRGTLLGSLLGVLPGGGHILAAFAAYTMEKRISKTPERFGKGAIEGVAAPESANNAGAQTSFIPLLTLGIPSNAVIALMAGALMIHGVQPGPQVMTKNPDIFWGLIASMLIGNIMLVVINLPLIRIWIQLLKVPYHLFYPMILCFMCIGTYSLNNSVFEVGLLVLFGFIGYMFVKWRCEPAPLLLAFVLGPLIEENLRRAMQISYGDPKIFFTRPISVTLLVMAACLLILVLLPAFKRTREVAFQEET